jgi:hypothetical protein
MRFTSQGMSSVCGMSAMRGSFITAAFVVAPPQRLAVNGRDAEWRPPPPEAMFQ